VVRWALPAAPCSSFPRAAAIWTRWSTRSSAGCSPRRSSEPAVCARLRPSCSGSAFVRCATAWPSWGWAKTSRTRPTATSRVLGELSLALFLDVDLAGQAGAGVAREHAIAVDVAAGLNHVPVQRLSGCKGRGVGHLQRRDVRAWHPSVDQVTEQHGAVDCGGEPPPALVVRVSRFDERVARGARRGLRVPVPALTVRRHVEVSVVLGHVRFFRTADGLNHTDGFATARRLHVTPKADHSQHRQDARDGDDCEQLDQRVAATRMRNGARTAGQSSLKIAHFTRSGHWFVAFLPLSVGPRVHKTRKARACRREPSLSARALVHSSGLSSMIAGESTICPLRTWAPRVKVDEAPSPFRSPFATAS